MKRILSLDGGGAKGVIQMKALSMLEANTGKRVFEMFDLIIGTSVGAINAAMLSTGKYSAQECLEIMQETLPKVFKRRFSLSSKYSKKALKIKFDELFGKDACLGDAKTKLIVTAYEDTEGRVHFFKSWEEKDSLIGLFEAVDRSSAAPFFFGQIADKESGKVWLDGGVGIFNNPALYAYIEAKRLGWRRQFVECFSIGCGHKNNARTFKEASKAKKLAQIFNYIDPDDGGLARRSASQEFSKALGELRTSKWTFRRIDSVIADKFDGMDKIKYFGEYCRIGEKLGYELIKLY